jgi:hypothetical protein
LKSVYNIHYCFSHSLNSLCSQRRAALEENHKFYQFLQDSEEEESWLVEKCHAMKNTDVGKDLPTCYSLVKKHQVTNASTYTGIQEWGFSIYFNLVFFFFFKIMGSYKKNFQNPIAMLYYRWWIGVVNSNFLVSHFRYLLIVMVKTKEIYIMYNKNHFKL